MKRSHAQFLTSVLLPTLLVASFGIFMTVMVQRLANDQRSRTTEALAASVNERLRSEFETSIATLRGLAAFWIGSEQVTSDEFDRYAAMVYDPEGALVALEWVDTDNVVRFVHPRAGENLKVIDLDNNKFPNRLTPILTAKGTRQPVMTAPILLAQGFPGVVINQPIYRGDEYLGMAVGVVRLGTLFKEASRSPYGVSDALFSSEGSTLRSDGAAIWRDGKRVISPSGDSVPDPAAPRFPEGLLRGVNTMEVATRAWSVSIGTEQGVSSMALALLGLTVGVTLICILFLWALYRVHRTLEATLSREHDFAALVSHQLRAPLTELNWMIDVVEDPQSSPAERAGTLADMRHIVREGVRTVAGLLTISRIERGVLEIKKEDVSVATIVDDALAPLRETAKEKRVTFHIDVPPGLTAAADADKAVEAVRNVVDNAVKYGPSGSTVEITALRTGDVVAMTVRDHGPGIPKDIRDTIFDKASTFSKKGTTEGAGLGLYISKMLLGLMGGTIRFDTGPGGTTFVMTLRANASETGKGNEK